jgi:hypothetical protein
VLGQNLAGDEDAVGPERAFSDHALALAEEVGQEPAIDDADRLVRVGDGEPGLRSVLLHAAHLDQAAEAETALGWDALLGYLARRIEEDEVVVQRRQHQRRRDAQHGERAHQKPQALALGRHRFLSRPRAASSRRARRRAAMLAITSPPRQTSATA